MTNILQAAQLARHAYAPEGPLPYDGIVKSSSIYDEELDVRVTRYENFDRNTHIVSVDGTNAFWTLGGIKDWIRNFTISKEELTPGVYAHAGYVRAAHKLKSQIHIPHQPNRTVVFNGHSAGGAIALALALLFEIEDSTVVTFGQPRLSTERELRQSLRRFGGFYIRVVNGRDVVPRVPAPIRFSHGGVLLYIDRNDRVRVNPSTLAVWWDRAVRFLSQRAWEHSTDDYVGEIRNAEFRTHS